MNFTRRRAVTMTGLGGAGLALSCASVGSTPTGRGGAPREDEMAEESKTHHVAIKACEQYVFVQVDSENPTSYRGKLVVKPGDEVLLANRLETEVLLVLPFMRQAEGGDSIAPKVLTEKREELPRCEPLVDLHVCRVDPDQVVVIDIPREVAGGHYEYSVLHRSEVLATIAGKQSVASLWAHALGGSSSEFIIRRPPFN